MISQLSSRHCSIFSVCRGKRHRRRSCSSAQQTWRRSRQRFSSCELIFAAVMTISQSLSPSLSPSLRVLFDIHTNILSTSFTRRTLTNYLICTARRTKGELAHTHYSSLQLARHERRSVQGLQRREGRFLSHRCAGFWPMGRDSDSARSMNDRICMSASLLVFTIHIDSD
jgi:hypothetical protein